MKKIFVLFLVAICGLMTAFGQLRVNNDFGQDLNVSINGNKIMVPYKGTRTFTASGRTAWLECSSLDGKIKFNVTKDVSRAGRITIEATDNVASNTTVNTGSNPISSDFGTNAVPLSQTTSNSNVAPPGGLAGILKNGKQSNAEQNVVNNTQKSVVFPVNVSPQPQPSASSEKIKVIYSGADRFKVFSDLGGGRWQGLEFRGIGSSDTTKDNAKNEYELYVQKDQDIHIGVIFHPEEAINEYGEFRKRLNKEDPILYINSDDIKKMSTDEKKLIRVKFTALNYKIYFEPESSSSDKSKEEKKNKPISLKSGQKSRLFLAPVGQFYLKVSCTDAKGMFHPTLFIPLHVTSGDNYVTISAADVDKAINADINLNWSKLR